MVPRFILRHYLVPAGSSAYDKRRENEGRNPLAEAPSFSVQRIKGANMESRREISLRLDSNVERGRPVRLFVDGQLIEAHEGESLAAAILASGRRVLRHTHPEGQPRGIFCGMGVCYECLVSVAGRERVRACIVEVEDGMRVSTQLE